MRHDTGYKALFSDPEMLASGNIALEIFECLLRVRNTELSFSLFYELILKTHPPSLENPSKARCKFLSLRCFFADSTHL